MKPLANPLAAVLAALVLAVALQAPSAPLRAQTASPVTAPSGAGQMWRPLIVVDPHDVLRLPRPHPTRKPGAAAKPHAAAKRHPGPYRRRAMPTPEVFERYDTAPSPHPR